MFTVPLVDSKQFVEHVKQATGDADLRKQEAMIRHRRISAHFHAHCMNDCESDHQHHTDHERFDDQLWHGRHLCHMGR